MKLSKILIKISELDTLRLLEQRAKKLLQLANKRQTKKMYFFLHVRPILVIWFLSCTLMDSQTTKGIKWWIYILTFWHQCDKPKFFLTKIILWCTIMAPTFHGNTKYSDLNFYGVLDDNTLINAVMIFWIFFF